MRDFNVEGQVLASLLRQKRVEISSVVEWAAELVRREASPPEWALDIAAFSSAHGQETLAGLLDAEAGEAGNAWRAALTATYTALYRTLGDPRCKANGEMGALRLGFL